MDLSLIHTLAILLAVNYIIDCQQRIFKNKLFLLSESHAVLWSFFHLGLVRPGERAITVTTAVL